MFENLKNGRERKKNALEHIKWENIAPSEQITIVKYQMKEVLLYFYYIKYFEENNARNYCLITTKILNIQWR